MILVLEAGQVKLVDRPYSSRPFINNHFIDKNTFAIDNLCLIKQGAFDYAMNMDAFLRHIELQDYFICFNGCFYDPFSSVPAPFVTTPVLAVGGTL